MPWKLRVAALGAVVEIDGAGLSEAQRAAVTAAWRDAVDSRGGVADATVQASGGADDADLLQDLSQRVTLAAIEARRGRLWMLHAAGVALDDGRVVAFVGPSGRGKTTAALTLGRAFGYVSDETVAIDPQGGVWPYRKPLSVIEDAAAPKRQRTPSEAGMRRLPDAPLRLAAVVLLDRQTDGPDKPVIEGVDLGDALTDLVEQTSYLPALDSPLQLIAAHVERTGGIRRVVYREAAGLAAVVQQLAAPSPDRSLGSTDVERAQRAETPLPPAPAFFRAAHADAITLHDPDRVAVLTLDAEGAGTVRLMAGVAPALWRAASGASLDDLVEAAVDAYGAPEDRDAETIVTAALAELTAATLIEHREPRWSIVSTVPWVDSGDRVVLLAPGEGLARAFDTSGTIIWRTLYEHGPMEIDDLTAAIAETAGVTADEVAPTLQPFLDDLAAIGVVSQG